MTEQKPPSNKQPPRSPRRRAREFALQGLYQWRVGGADEAAIEAHLPGMEGFQRADQDLCFGLIRGVLRQRKTLEAHLADALDRPFDELSPVEAIILLISTYEMAQSPETPYPVIINEAIELAKGFGGTDGHRYVNGVLDKMAIKLRSVEVAARRKK